MMCSEEGKEYEFRVFAENEVGESDPLQTSRSIIAKNQYCEYQEFGPQIARNDLIKFCDVNESKGW